MYIKLEDNYSDICSYWLASVYTPPQMKEWNEWSLDKLKILKNVKKMWKNNLLSLLIIEN